MGRARAVSQQLVDDLRGELDGIITAQSADPPDDEHDVEGSSVGFERARITALLSSAEAHVAELDAASARMASGDYGRCENCGADIGGDRLEAVPTATRCMRCAAPTRPSGVRP
ncbi:MAG TPA: TraR/DksA C4-type zinc finger protein [Acidimicrobiales bacterium]|nr:TraR/DksA C4-type zinc finger protein [Acidimicrobiales bacterium]